MTYTLRTFGVGLVSCFCKKQHHTFNPRSPRPCLKRHPLPRQLGLQKHLDRPCHVLTDVNTEGLYVEGNTLAAPLFVGLLKGPSHVWHLREQRVGSLRHLATPSDVWVRVAVATVLQTPAAELARARAAADGKAAFKVEEGPPTAAGSPLQCACGL